MHIETVFQYNRQELLHLDRIGRRRWWITRYVFAAITAAGALVPALPTEVRVAFATCAAVTALLVEPRLRRAARVGAKNELNTLRTYEITTEAFTSRQGAVTRSLSWSEMHSVSLKREWWHLHITEQTFTMFPTRALTADQRAEFETFLASQGWAATDR